MEFLTDWRMWLFIITLTGIIINWLANHKLMTNHFHHLSLDVKEIKDNQKEQGDEIKKLQTDISYIKGSKQNEAKIIEVLKETLKK